METKSILLLIFFSSFMASCVTSKKVIEANHLELEELISRQFAEDETIFWSEDNRLTWDDFQIRTKSRPNYLAESATGIYSFWKCKASQFEFIVGAVFDKQDSWVKSSVKLDTPEQHKLLNHEQRHFDLSECYARKIRKALSGLAHPCGGSDKEIRKIINRYLEEFHSEEKRYDRETNHGLNEEKQFSWDQKIHRQLQELTMYRSSKSALP
jgi:hypothetical protein